MHDREITVIVYVTGVEFEKIYICQYVSPTSDRDQKILRNHPALTRYINICSI